MITISERVQALAPAATLAMAQKSAELRQQGIDVISLAVGEPDFPTPDFIKEAAKKAIDDNFSHYSPVPGYMSLRRAIADNLYETNRVEYLPEQIVVSTGAKQALCNTILALVNPGDEVIIPTPAWVSYVEMVKLAEGKSVLVETHMEQNFKLSPEQLESAITPRTRMIILCSPSNPSGAVYTREELQGLVEVFMRHPDVIILSDEIYQHINYTGSYTSMGSFQEISDRTIVINGVSKAYAMTGWRIGFVAAPIEVAKAVTKLQGQYTSGTSSIAQKAAEGAYTGPQDCVLEMCEAFRRRRDLVVAMAKNIPGWELNTPDGAFYIFPRVKQLLGKTTPKGKTIATSGDLVMYLLEEAHVATVDGAAFCLPGYIRLSYAASDEDLVNALNRIQTAVTALR